MILTDCEIKLAIEKKLIIIDPVPGPLAFSSTAVDLTLDSHITEFKEKVGGIEIIIDPADPAFKPEITLAEISEKREIGPDGYLLKPAKLVLAWTVEYEISSQCIALPQEWKVKAPSLDWGLGSI